MTPRKTERIGGANQKKNVKKKQGWPFGFFFFRAPGKETSRFLPQPTRGRADPEGGGENNTRAISVSLPSLF